MKILIAIACHSWPQYFTLALESALRLGPNVAAFIDQGPNTARYEEYAERFATDNPSGIVHWHSIGTIGAAASRNAAFRYALKHGYEFVIPLDDDDILLEGARELEALQRESGADIVYGDFVLFDTGPDMKNVTCPEFSSERLWRRPFISSTSMISVEVWKAVRRKNRHGYDPHMDELGGWEDYLFYVEADLLGFQFAHLAMPVLAWRQHEEGRTAGANRNVEAIVAYMREKTGLEDIYRM